MHREPVFYVQIEGQDLPYALHVRSLEFSGSDKKQDRLTLTFEGLPAEAVDHPLLQEGLQIEARWGYLDGDLSDKVILKIKDVTPRFGRTVSLTLKAYSKEHKAKGRAAKNVWANKKDSDIVKDVARALGFKAEVDGLPITRPCYQQAGRDYFEVLTDLAYRNNCVWWERNGTLFFRQEAGLMGQTPDTGFEYRAGAGSLVSFEVKNRSEDKKQKGPGKQTQHAGADILKKRRIDKRAHDGRNDQRVALGRKTQLRIDAESGRATQVPGTFNQKRGETGQTHCTTQQDPKVARHEARAANARAAHRELKASAEFIGLPFLREKTIITVTGVSKKHSGNWYVQTCRHHIDSGGYKTSCDLVRGGSQSPKTSGAKTRSRVNADQADPNKKSGQKTRQVVVVPADGGQPYKKAVKS